MTGLTYVYCLVRAARRPSLRNVPPGVPGSTDLRALNAGDRVWAIVATVPAADYDEAALSAGLQDIDWVGARAMAHESIVEHFLSAPGLLPLQLFTLFTSDERALEHVQRDRAGIDRILSRVSGHLEWGLRLSFDEQAARAAAAEAGASSEPGRARGGRGYLASKRDMLRVSRTQLAAAMGEADRLYREMARAAADARRRTATEQGLPGSRLLLDAAFLVPTRRTGAFRAALRQHVRRLTASGLVVSLTGPWPAYNFISPPPRSGKKRSIARKTSTRAKAGAARAATKRSAARATPARASSSSRRQPSRAASRRR